jgi:hypothetical protein
MDRGKLSTFKLRGALRHATGRATIERMSDDEWAEMERLAALHRLIKSRRDQAKAERYQRMMRRPSDV